MAKKKKTKFAPTKKEKKKNQKNKKTNAANAPITCTYDLHLISTANLTLPIMILT